MIFRKREIETNVVDGALLLREYEKSARSPFNFYRSNELVNQVILDLESSKNYYAAARDIGKKIGYIEKKVS